MIGTHNTMTYLKAKNPLYEAISCWWRCQNKTLDDQIAAGVRWFDIRVVFNPRPGGPLWTFAHGAVDLKYKTDEDIPQHNILGLVLEKIEACGGYARIMLERGNDEAEELFAEYFAKELASKRWPCIIGAVVKKNWRVLWNTKPDLAICDLSYVPYKRDTKWWKQLKGILGFPWKSLKKRAAEGVRPTKRLESITNKVWIYDYL
jgi:hypothetical protein